MADWGKITSRGDVEDRRGASPLLLGGGGLGLAGAVIVILFNLLAGGSSGGNIDIGNTLNQLQQAQASQQSGSASQFQGQNSYETFASEVLGSTNDTWKGIFSQSNKTYTPPKLVLFRGYTQSGCGGASSDMGPHYCPADQTIYLDETFFDELTTKLGGAADSKGDVAQAYVIAHEVGHHVQDQLGTTAKVESSLRSNTPAANKVSVQIELQADCFAGVWAHAVSQEGIIQKAEINEALDAASAVGDDHVQKAIQGRVNPETWTHGSSAQRVHWFTAGYDSGKPTDCNTFAS